jgi:FkbM family methyltransferase
MQDPLKLRAIAATTRLASIVREHVRFWLRVATRNSGLGRYRLRGSDVVVFIRHGTVDVLTLEEIFRLGHYRLPAPVADILGRSRPPLRVVDLGANVGLFGAYVRRRFPLAEITAFEPHPANVEVLKRTIEANGAGGGWRLVAACADVRDGTLPFSLEGLTTSRVDASADRTVTVPAVDVFPFLEDVDLLKIDVEGAEWRLLSDHRFTSAAARTIALEYHPHGAPAPDAGAAARTLLSRAGYEHEEVAFDLPPGYGMIWAWRRE